MPVGRFMLSGGFSFAGQKRVQPPVKKSAKSVRNLLTRIQTALICGLPSETRAWLMPDPLMVRERTLTPSIKVRVLVGHPNTTT